MELFWWMLIVTVVESVALTLLQIGGTVAVVLAAAIYAIGVVPLLVKALSFEEAGVGMVNFVWNLFSTLIMFVIGIGVFGEQITPTKTVGVLVALVGISILMLAE